MLDKRDFLTVVFYGGNIPMQAPNFVDFRDALIDITKSYHAKKDKTDFGAIRAQNILTLLTTDKVVANPAAATYQALQNNNNTNSASTNLKFRLALAIAIKVGELQGFVPAIS